MILASELRLGNYVLMNGKVERMTEDYMSYMFERAVIGFDTDLYPIHLTTEILLNCGFELFPWGWVKKSKSDFGVRLQVKSFSYEVSGNNPVQIKYLHQLQNLYFSLTGEGLTIKTLVSII